MQLLFEHGAFSAERQRRRLRSALMWLALGLPAHVLVKALSPAFFARRTRSTPLLATREGVVLAIAAALSCSAIGSAPSGIAAAIALAAWSSAFCLIRPGAERFGFSIDASAKRAAADRSSVGARAWARLLWLARCTPCACPGAHAPRPQAVELLGRDICGNRNLRPRY